MDKSLNQYAQDKGVSFTTAWRHYKAGKIENAEVVNGKVVIHEAPKVAVAEVQKLPKLSTIATGVEAESFDLFNSTSLSTASTRGNKSAITEPAYRFQNIADGIVPFTTSSYGGNSYVSIKDAIELCQKCYYNFSIYRNIIDLMVEFASGKINFVKGNKESRRFFESYFQTVNLASFQRQFFRELFRSCNVFPYAFEVKFSDKAINEISKEYGLSMAANTSLPARYIILNPADMLIGGNTTFLTPVFYKKLTAYEVERLKNPKTDEEKRYYDSLSPEGKKKVNESKGGGEVIIPLDKSNLYYIPYNKQDYEPFAVPLGYCVLDDINRKEEMKKMDAQICRTMQQVVLLVKTGYESKNGEYVVNQKTIESLKKIFENQSVGRVLVSDFTTEAEFIIPQIGDVLDPKKYEVLDRDISVGLNNIITGSTSQEKYSNKSISVEIFVERLRQAREIFLDEFLIPEIKRISRKMNFKTYPVPEFQEIMLKNEIDYARIYTRLAEIGILTPEETIDAIKTYKLPTPEESVENQKKLVEYKKDGLYEPLIGGGNKDEEGAAKVNGRPAGTKAPQTTKKISPIGAESQYSLKKLVANMNKASDLAQTVKTSLLKKFKLKKLSEAQNSVAEEIADCIIANESVESWEAKVAEYVENPLDKNPDRVKEIQDIALEHQLDSHTASLLYWSKI